MLLEQENGSLRDTKQGVGTRHANNFVFACIKHSSKYNEMLG